MVSVLLAKEAKLDLFLKGVHLEIKGLCASAQPGVAFRRLCSQSVVLEGVGWGGGSLSLAYSQTVHLGTWVDLCSSLMTLWMLSTAG